MRFELDVGLAKIQSLMGHSNANRTAQYDRRGEWAKGEGVRLLGGRSGRG